MRRGTTTIVIASGSTRWFKLAASIGTLSGSGTSETIQVQLEGDSAYPSPAGWGANVSGNMFQASTTDRGGNLTSVAASDFIWSPRSTSTAEAIADLDWTNGYGVPGLPSSNMTVETLSK